MKKMKFKFVPAFILALAMILVSLTGCARVNAPKSQAKTKTALASGGVLYLNVNPEISVAYDKDGNVTKIDGRNDDGSTIIENFSDYEGKSCRQVVSDLVNAIGEAGYFVEEIDGKSRQITIEIEAGSSLPYDTFLDEVVSDVRECVSLNKWHSPIAVEGESDYGITDYADTDYGPNNDGVTDYDDTDYGPNNDGVTDYNDTDYGPNNDGVTDYNDGNSNYDDGNSNYDD